MHVMMALCSTIVTALTFILLAHAEDEIVMTHILYRHGDRSPILSYPTNPYSESDWPQGYGQLSKIGMKQQYDLGKFLREKYIAGKPYRLLNSSYHRLEIEVRSTDVDRTLMSAYSNLAGLYPPGGDQVWNKDLPWQPIPVHTVPKKEDYLIHMEVKCPKYDQAYAEVLNSEEVKQFHKDNEEFFKFVSNETKKDDLSIKNLWEIHDSIFCESQHNFTLPNWVFRKINGKTVLDILNDMNSVQFDFQYNRRDEAKLRGGSLLYKMLNDTRSKIRNVGEAKKAYIYSSHDDTMSAFLSAMKVFNRVSPPYAACAMVDVFRANGNSDDEMEDNHYVVISYRNSSLEKPYQLKLEGCDVKCPLAKFHELVKDNLVQNFERECNFNQDYMVLVVLALLLVLILTVLMTTCIIIIRKQRVQPAYFQI